MKFWIEVGQMKQRRIEYEKYRKFLDNACSNAMKTCEIPVEFSPNGTWVKAVCIAGKGASEVERTEAGKPLGRSSEVHPGQNQGSARL